MKDSGRDQLDWGPGVQKSLPKGVPTESSTVALDPGVLSANLQARAGQDVQCRGNHCGCSVEGDEVFAFSKPIFQGMAWGRNHRGSGRPLLVVPEVENTKLLAILASHNDIYFLMKLITRIYFLYS